MASGPSSMSKKKKKKRGWHKSSYFLEQHAVVQRNISRLLWKWNASLLEEAANNRKRKELKRSEEMSVLCKGNDSGKLRLILVKRLLPMGEPWRVSSAASLCVTAGLCGLYCHNLMAEADLSFLCLFVCLMFSNFSITATFLLIFALEVFSFLCFFVP